MAVLQAAILGKFFAEWWQGLKGDQGCLADLDRCGPDEIRRMARDLSLTTGELRALAGTSDSAELLYRRMADLGLDRTKLALAEPNVMRDMQRLCTLCAGKARCQRDLLGCADPATAWHAYCPNDETLLGLTLW